jgi:thioredoxin-like negative regulator of GroEL
MAPEVEAVARERAGRALVLKVDTEVWPELSARFGLQAIPSFLVFRNGRIVSRHVGAAPRAELVRWLDEASENRRNPRWT